MAFTMTSLPWSENKTTYTDDDWSDVWRKLFVRDRTTQGVLYGYENELEVTNPSGVTIRVATGAALVDGKFTENDTQRDFTVVAPGIGSNYYTIILQKIWGDEEVYLDILGPDIAAPPTVNQTDGNTWEISLATVQINSVSSVTITDTRAFAFSPLSPGRTRRFLVPCIGVYNRTDTTYYDAIDQQGPVQPDNKESLGYGQFMVPDDFSSDMKVSAVIGVPTGSSGNFYGSVIAYYGTAGQSYNTHNDSSGSTAVAAVTADFRNQIFETILSSVAEGDMVSVSVSRRSDLASDTINDITYIHGFLVEYTADS